MDKTSLAAPVTPGRGTVHDPRYTDHSSPALPEFPAAPPTRAAGGTHESGETWVGQTRVDLGLRPYLRLWQQYRKLIAAVVLVCVAGSVVRILMSPEIYMATTTILPSGSQSNSGMLGLLASMTGVPPVVGGASENSSALFPRIIKSREVGLEVLNTRFQYHVAGAATEGTLMQYLQAKNEDEGLLGLDAVRAVDVDKETGIISVSVRTPEPALSAAIANRTVQALERFNNEARHREASENSTFIDERLARAQAELALAEDALATFKEENLRMSSPELEMELMRLTRDATLKSQIFVTLANQAEVARVEEAKDLPIVRVLDRAIAPTLPVPVPKLSILVAGVLVGGVLAILLVAGLKFIEYVRLEATDL